MTAPTPPLELRRPIDQDAAVSDAVRDAMRAALCGDWSAADRLELAYLNLMVRIGELVIRHPDGRLHRWSDYPQDERYRTGIFETQAPFVVGILRGFTRDARTALQWALHEKCRRCDGKLRRLPCRVCDGRWYLEDMNDHELVYTDIEGVLLEEAA